MERGTDTLPASVAKYITINTETAMNRREFLTWVGAGALATSLPVAIAACSPNAATNPSSPSANNSTTTPQSAAGSTGFQAVGSVAELDKAGQILNKQLPVGPVLVIRNPADASSLLAVNPTCSHKSCSLVWQAGEKVLKCPCHDSDFAPDGKVLKGPAKQPLKTYEAKIEGDSVLVKVS
ncbi:ubiquinol-cytochrome c reductase iron-sulfur subunit [Microcoleus sp. FACHB-672]|uniref:QcrA and Rieske domain-containing protein n=1 Tax=Microcoleus sp. FACHB-672 TaxID=2692825 RepID=UPI002816511B|nr:ubiquinol-cytochrome c reductase iron-sulfur subunit [Microcoleus sp. FACHB-672]